jgi:hypothetical protein
MQHNAKDGASSITIALGEKDARKYTIVDVMESLNLTRELLEKELKEF